MLPFVERFRPIFEHYNLDLIIPEVHERLSEEELLAYAGKFDGTICGDDRYTRRVLAACTPRLKVISKWGTGIDSIDLAAAAELGVMVGNTPNAFTVPVAENVLGYMLAFARQLPWMDDAMKASQWEKIPGITLSECTLGVVGVGNVGKAVLRRARAFGMKLLGNDIVEIAPDFLVEYGVEMTALADLLARADFISLNCSLNATSYHLINAQTLSLVKPGAILINTSRGPVVDEPALVEQEPLPAESPLRSMPNVMLAPHNSNSSPFYWERVHWNSIRNLLLGLQLPVEELDSLRAAAQPQSVKG